ncbi:MAG: hypothetical protein ACTSO9_03705 [Candidatus Helarchaeota archaeon]
MQKKQKIRHWKTRHKGHLLKRARDHREETLKEIVVEVFKDLSFSELDWRTLPNYHSHKYEPDVFLKNEDCLLIIELKAYHKNTICAEREAAQILKYAAAVKSVIEKFKDYSRKRFLLITSGTLMPLKNLHLNFQDDINLIKKRYDELLEQVKVPRTQDDYDRRSTYRKLVKKIEKGNPIFPSDLLEYFPIKCEEIKNKSSLIEFIEREEEILVGFVSAENFQKIISEFNKKQIKFLFELLRSIPIETLVKGKTISEYIF